MNGHFSPENDCWNYAACFSNLGSSDCGLLPVSNWVLFILLASLHPRLRHIIKKRSLLINMHLMDIVRVLCEFIWFVRMSTCRLYDLFRLLKLFIGFSSVFRIAFIAFIRQVRPVSFEIVCLLAILSLVPLSFNMSDAWQINTKDILFICGGAFVDLEKTISERFVMLSHSLVRPSVFSSLQVLHVK